MRILVTGGAALAGSHLCDKLLAQGHELVCLNNVFTGSKANIAHLFDEPNVESVRRDRNFFDEHCGVVRPGIFRPRRPIKEDRARRAGSATC